MTKEDSLYDLVQSLDSSEKRLFKMFALNHSAAKNMQYLDLFDLLNNMSEYDELKLKKKLKEKNTLKNLAQAKKYLKDLILKSMREIDDVSAADKVNILLKEASFLSKKNLFKEQWKKLEKAKEIAQKYELFSDELKILDIQMKYRIERNFDAALTHIEDYKRFKKELLFKDKCYQEMISSKNFLFLLIRKNRRKFSEENKLLAESIITNLIGIELEKYNSFRIQTLYYNINSLYYNLLKDKIKTKDFREKSVSLYNDFPHFLDVSTSNYIIVYFNYVASVFHLEDFKKVNELLNNIESLKLKNENEKGEFFQSFANFKILLFLNTSNVKDAFAFESFLTAGLKKYDKKINFSSRLTLCYNYSLIFFMNKEYTKCLDWLAQIETIKSNVRKDLQAFSKILTMICWLELDEKSILESLSRSVRRGESLNAYEKLLVSNVLKISKSDNNLKKEILLDFKQEIDQLIIEKKFEVGIYTIQNWLSTKQTKG